MRLLALYIDRLPGIDPGFKLEDIRSGINVVVGPNASGKSSLLREQGYIDDRDALAPPLPQPRAYLPDDDTASAEAATLVRHLEAGMVRRADRPEVEETQTTVTQ